VPTALPLATLRDVAPIVPGLTFAYVVDVRDHAVNRARIVRLARNADLLFVECAFLDADAAQAARKNHLTAAQAGGLARAAQVKRLVPCHISTRYADRAEAVAAEAEQAFRGASDSDAPAAQSNATTRSCDAPPARGAT